MNILHLTLGGCLKAPPISFGLTADTGGHIAYVLDAAIAQAACSEVDHVEIVTRLFDDPLLGAAYAEASETIKSSLSIRRITTANRGYLEKEALAAHLPAFTDAFCAYLASMPRLPDVIHTHFSDAAEIAAEAGRRFRIPFVYTPHALGIDKRVQGGRGAALNARIAQERAAIERAAAIIVSTCEEAERQVAAYDVPGAAARTHCISPGVPARAVDSTAPTIAGRLGEWLDAPDRPILLVIARPVRKKNIAALLRGYAAEPALHSLANIVILAGQHDGRASSEEAEVVAELRAMITVPPLRGRVAFPARHDGADVAALYRRAAAGGVFVNPALHEPFGLTLLEAASAGVPVVATNAGGPTEILARIGHGTLIDPRDDAGIADACLRIVSDPALHRRLAAAGPAGASLYNWDRYAAASIATYETLLPAPALLACDIDNTLTGCAEGAAAFAAWAARRDIPFVVATGRGHQEAVDVLRRWRLPEPDAYIVDVGTHIVRRDAAGQWTSCADYRARLDTGWDAGAVERALAGLQLRPQADATRTPYKLSFFGDVGDAATIRASLEVAGLAARVVFSHARLIDVLAPAGGKAAAVSAYAAGLGLSPAACVAAGDSGNDADMLAACGRAIIVANADPDLAGLAPRRGLYRAGQRHALGVVEGLAAHGIGFAARKVAA